MPPASGPKRKGKKAAAAAAPQAVEADAAMDSGAQGMSGEGRGGFEGQTCCVVATESAFAKQEDSSHVDPPF